MALLVGGVGVANTMVISVLERNREIGLRRALGSTRGQIRAESVALCLLGGFAGVLGAAATRSPRAGPRSSRRLRWAAAPKPRSRSAC